MRIVMSIVLIVWAGLAAAQGLPRQEVIDLQAYLAGMGYRPLLGSVDGAMGPGTRAAIRAFEAETGMAVTGEPSRAVREAVRHRHASGWDRGQVRGQGRPSFDCARAGTSTERAICASPRLARLDRDVAAAYARARGGAAAAARDRLLRDQRAWLRLRDGCGGDAMCIDHAMTGRIAILGGILSR